MTLCNHSSWLALYRHEQMLFRYTSKLSDIVESLYEPFKKGLSLVMLVGDDKITSSVIPGAKKGRCCVEPAGVHLQLDVNTAFNDCPMLYAQTRFPEKARICHEQVSASCHRETTREIQWQDSDSNPAKTAYALHHSVIYPFADLICLFLTNGDGFERVVNYLRAWSRQPWDSSHRSLPRVLVVTAPSDQRSPETIKDYLLRLVEEQSSPLSVEQCSAISVFARAQSKRMLNTQIYDEVATSQQRQNHTMLNALHFDRLFRYACDSFAGCGHEGFSLLKGSRLHRPVSSSLRTHLADILERVESYEEVKAFAAPFIADSLLSDHYTRDVPRMASEPEMVFSTFYRAVCTASTGNKRLLYSGSTESTLLRAGLVNMIEQQFVEKTRSYGFVARDRSMILKDFRRWLSPIKTYRSCLACLQRTPEYKFPCDHMLCESCCLELGQCIEQDPHLYTFTECPVCALSCLVKIRVRPVTAGIRVLSIDGGGIRAVIPIEFLRALEQAIGLDMPVQEHFDLTFGTSSGSLVALALYEQGMSVDATHDLFLKLARRVFRGRNHFGIGFAAAAHALLATYRSGRFPAEDIDSPLAEIFGETEILRHPYMTSIGARLGLPVVNVNTLETSIITSYNVARESENQANASDMQMSTYQVLRSSGPQDNILIKDAARCASAAPWYFTPHEIPHHGKFMDGGLSNNNPMSLAFQEQRILVPHLVHADQFVSVGTGVCKTRTETRPGFLFGKNSLYQTAQHYLTDNFDGDKEFYNNRNMIAGTLPDQGSKIDCWLRRFNVSLDTDLPDLADVGAMESLADAAWTHFASHSTVQDLSRAILASTFYFELRCMPFYENGSYTCYGRIRCRIPVTNPSFPALVKKLDAMKARFFIQGRRLKPRKSSAFRFDRWGNINQPVCVYVKQLDEQVDVCLQLSNTYSYPISASPLSVQRLIRLQKLDWADTRTSRPRHPSTLKRQRSTSDTRKRKRICR